MNKKRIPILKRVQVIRLTRLLNMMYTPAEIAHELGVNKDTIYRSYLPAGLPHTRDKKNIWIHGTACAEWARATIAKRKNKRAPLPDGFAWCLFCNQPAQLNTPRICYQNRYIKIMQGTCAACGRPINRAYASRSDAP